jgi:hypothetical protein
MYILPIFCKVYKLQEVGFLFSKLLQALKGIISNYTILMIIAVGIFTLIFDGRRYRQKGYMRELKIVKIISYSYMVIGGLMFILLLMM